MAEATRVCGWCGADLSGRRPNVQYCTRSHKERAGNQRHQERVAGDSATYWRQYRAARKPADWKPKDRRQWGTTKRCSRCKQTLPLDAFYWVASRKAPSSKCRACRSAADKERCRARRGLPPDAVLTCANLDVKPEGWSYVHHGYVMVKKPGHHRATKDGYVYEHILVAEEKYGIEITTAFTVHHLNADRQDNRPDNLELRLGHHGRGGDVMHTLLRRPEMREQAADALAGWGWTVIAPLNTINEGQAS